MADKNGSGLERQHLVKPLLIRKREERVLQLVWRGLFCLTGGCNITLPNCRGSIKVFYELGARCMPNRTLN